MSVDNTTSTSVLIRWTNLTSILNRQVLHYIILLNKTNGNALIHEITDGNNLNMEISGLKHSTDYTVEVVGVDYQGRPYKTLEVNATTQNSTNSYYFMNYFFLSHGFASLIPKCIVNYLLIFQYRCAQTEY